MYGFWGIVVLVGMLNRLFTALVQRKMPRTFLDTEASRTQPQVGKPRLSGARRWIQRYITLPAALGYRHQQPLGWCTVPTRIQSLLVSAFVVINVILCSVTYRAFEGNVLYEHLPTHTFLRNMTANPLKHSVYRDTNVALSRSSYGDRGTCKHAFTLGFRQ